MIMIIMMLIIIITMEGRREALRNTAVRSTNSELYTKIWVGETDGTTDIYWHQLNVLITPQYSFENVSSQITYLTAWLSVWIDSLLKHVLPSGHTFIGRILRPNTLAIIIKVIVIKKCSVRRNITFFKKSLQNV